MQEGVGWLKAHGVKYRILDFGEAEFYESFTKEQHSRFRKNLEDYGIEIIENQRTALVQKIKNVITEMVFSDEIIPAKASVYIAEKLNHSCGYLSNLFSETTFLRLKILSLFRRLSMQKN